MSRADELRLEGQVVDLGAANISLEYVNNLLSDPSKISASHTYTIVIPRTARNERVMDYCTSVSHRSRIVGVPLRADYFRNGFRLLLGATAEVTAVSPEGVELAIYWNGLSAASAWLTNAPRLRDLPIPERVWTGTATASASIYNEVIEADYDTGVKRLVMPPPPCVNAWSLFQRIMNGIGVPWSAPREEVVEQMRRLVLPLCSRAGRLTPNLGGRWSGLNAVFETPHDAELYVSPTGNTGGNMPVSEYTIGVDATLDTLQITFDATWRASDYDEEEGGVFGTEAALRIYNAAGSLVWEQPMEVSEDGLEARLSASVTLANPGTSFRVAVFHDNEYIYALEGSGVMDIAPTTKTATVGALYNVAGNLPDISQVDYIKALCNLHGVQLVNRTDGSLEFVGVGELYDRIDAGVAVNWSDKVVDYLELPNGVDFKVGEYAQLNRYKYKADEENLGVDADAVLEVEGRALPAERVAVELPFAATRGDTIRHYKAGYDTDGATWRVEDQAVQPRILTAYAGTDGKVHARFEGSQSWGAILARYYQGVRRLLEYPVQVRLFARLTERDLALLDYTTPVYLRQTGKYYIVARVNTDTSTETSELTLIQL